MSARKPKDTNAAQARVLTPAQIAARKWFEDTGMSVAAWSRQHGFSEVLVSLVLNGKRHPAFGIMNAAQTTQRLCAAELGLTMASRAWGVVAMLLRPRRAASSFHSSE